MAEVIQVSIGIQARSTSKRFPGKVFEMIGPKMLLQHVIDACKSSAAYLNNFTHRTRIRVDVFLLVPKDDEEIKRAFRGKLPIIDGSEDDVLERYKKMLEMSNADFVVRITGDCPLIKPSIITKHINAAVQNKYAYCANVDEECRTSLDGYDCEVISSELLSWLHEFANGVDREHVTTLVRKSPPEWARNSIGYIVDDRDQSNIKLSVDTKEDLENVRSEYEKRDDKYQIALKKVGKVNVHSF